MEDRKGLDVAYSLNSGSYLPQGNAFYVAGTKSARDVWDDLTIPLFLTTWSDRYQNADRALDASLQVTRIVGHSLGGTVALELAKNHPGRQLETETYGAPVFSFSGSAHRHRHYLDPVASLDAGAQTTAPPGLNPHSYQALVARKRADWLIKQHHAHTQRS